MQPQQRSWSSAAFACAQPLLSSPDRLPRAPAEGDPANVGHVITTSGGVGASRQVIRYLTERVVGNGSFGVVFQAKCIETGETVRGGLLVPLLLR